MLQTHVLLCLYISSCLSERCGSSTRSSFGCRACGSITCSPARRLSSAAISRTSVYFPSLTHFDKAPRNSNGKLRILIKFYMTKLVRFRRIVKIVPQHWYHCSNSINVEARGQEVCLRRDVRGKISKTKTHFLSSSLRMFVSSFVLRLLSSYWKCIDCRTAIDTMVMICDICVILNVRWFCHQHFTFPYLHPQQTV